MTSYTYDRWGRPLSVVRPGSCSGTHGETDVSYTDSVPVAVTKTQKLCGSNGGAAAVSQTTVFDGLGRLSQTQLTTDPSGTVYTDTTYDTLGRKSTVSNPYRSKSDSTYGLTTYT